MKHTLRIAKLAKGVAFVGSPLIPVDRSNPPIAGDIEASTDVKTLLKRACYDCHSNETRLRIGSDCQVVTRA